jgi:hypothetical protein
MTIDNQVRRLLGEALPHTTPLPATDHDKIIALGRRRLRVRRLTTAGAGLVAAAVLVAGIGLLPNEFATGSGAIIVGGPGRPSATATPTVVGTAPGYEFNATTAARLTTALKAAMSQTLPGATFSTDPTGTSPALEFPADAGEYLARAKVTDASGWGTVRLHAAYDVQEWHCTAPGVTAGEVSCDEGTGTGGEKWVFDVINDAANGRPDIIMYQLIVSKPDGTNLQLSAENSDSIRNAGGTPTRPTPPMTKEQMLAVALDPGLTLHP